MYLLWVSDRHLCLFSVKIYFENIPDVLHSFWNKFSSVHEFVSINVINMKKHEDQQDIIMPVTGDDISLGWNDI